MTNLDPLSWAVSLVALMGYRPLRHKKLFAPGEGATMFLSHSDPIIIRTGAGTGAPFISGRTSSHTHAAFTVGSLGGRNMHDSLLFIP